MIADRAGFVPRFVLSRILTRNWGSVLEAQSWKKGEGDERAVEVDGTHSEKTREVTRPGQAGLSKILSLSAVPARNVTTHD